MRKIPYKSMIWMDGNARRIALSRQSKRKIKRNWKKRRSIRIPAPATFRFLDWQKRIKLFEFIDLVKVNIRNNIRVVIDFEKTKDVHPCGLLIFMSNIDVLLYSYPSMLSCTYPEDPVIEQLFQHMGILEKFGLSSRKVVDHDTVKYWHHHSGSDADSTTYTDLTKAIRDKIIHPNKELFADCLNEAVNNTVGHAYKYPIKRMPPKVKQKWWMLSLLRDNLLFVAIYDLGMGIPQSLKRKPEFFDYFKLRSYNDSRLIEAAIGSHLTSTKLPHRGKGLPEMFEFSRNLKKGGFSVWSKNGGFTYNAETEEPKRHKVDPVLPGTLVLWSIPFRKEQENENNYDFHSK